MVGEVLALLGAAPGHVLVDLTVGAGGHADAFLRATAPTGSVFASDRDSHALALARQTLQPFGDRVRFRHGDAVSVLAGLAADGVVAHAVLLDLGVSSMQLDDADRGFSLRDDGPLDMRMDGRHGPTAADLVNTLAEAALAEVFREHGDEPAAARIARALVARRRLRTFRSTGDLRSVVEQALGRRGGRVHPATRVFQALRIAVNREDEQLRGALPAALARLLPGGRLAVIAFHSGEDRVVKTFFAERARQGDRLLTPRPARPGRDELRSNRRSRSARLRVLQRGGAQP